jgi:hypothetical protein
MTPLPVFVVGRRSWRPRSLHSSWTLPKFLHVERKHRLRNAQADHYDKQTREKDQKVLINQP